MAAHIKHRGIEPDRAKGFHAVSSPSPQPQRKIIFKRKENNNEMNPFLATTPWKELSENEKWSLRLKIKARRHCADQYRRPYKKRDDIPAKKNEVKDISSLCSQRHDEKPAVVTKDKVGNSDSRLGTPALVLTLMGASLLAIAFGSVSSCSQFLIQTFSFKSN